MNDVKLIALRMARIARLENEIGDIKEQLLLEAEKIMTEEGFHSFSMRKLATKVSMTAANLYNYYTNKDHILLAIQTQGFEQMYQKLEVANHKCNNNSTKITAMVSAYIQFALENKNLYDIMFHHSTAKYADYVGSEIEPIAKEEKDVAMKVANFTASQIMQTTSCSFDKALKVTISLWSYLHGLVSLYNANLLQEVVPINQTFIVSLAIETVNLTLKNLKP